MDELAVGGRRYRVDRARQGDVAALVALLHDDTLGARREVDDLEPYLAAFERIDSDPAHLLVAVRDQGGAVVATMQLTLIPGLARGGGLRLQIETVRVAAAARGGGLGTALLRWAADYGRAHGARMAQLTTDKRRLDAHRFYERLGYVASHEGMKLSLE